MGLWLIFGAGVATGGTAVLAALLWLVRAGPSDAALLEQVFRDNGWGWGGGE
jgi:hypothetical protein